jgi:hypothetical protein
LAAWNRQYNISGSVHCDANVEAWCDVLRQVLRTNDVGIISHFTGAVSVFAESSIGFVASSGFDNHDFCALVPGNRANWLRVAVSMEVSLTAAGVPYSLEVHDSLLTLP